MRAPRPGQPARGVSAAAPPVPCWLGPGALAPRPTRKGIPPELAAGGPASLSPTPFQQPRASGPCAQTAAPRAGGICVLGSPGLSRAVARSLKPSARPPLHPKLAGAGTAPRAGTAPHPQGEKPRGDAGLGPRCATWWQSLAPRPDPLRGAQGSRPARSPAGQAPGGHRNARRLLCARPPEGTVWTCGLARVADHPAQATGRAVAAGTTVTNIPRPPAACRADGGGLPGPQGAAPGCGRPPGVDEVWGG